MAILYLLHGYLRHMLFLQLAYVLRKAILTLCYQSVEYDTVSEFPPWRPLENQGTSKAQR